MILLSPDAPVYTQFRGAAVAIGNFDGVHRGHQALLAKAGELARREGRPWGVLTFEPHPRTFFRPSEPVFRLSPLPLKTRLVAALGADFLLPLPFDGALAGLEAVLFVEQILAARLGVGHLVTGFDFHFGRGRKGNAELLRTLGPRCGFGLTEVEQVTGQELKAPFSSSAIRSALRHGSVIAAAQELGYRWTVLGPVTRGDGRGQTIGFPTANIVLDPGAEPRDGIYAARVRDLALPPPRPAVSAAAYIGTRPTFASKHRFLEVHLLDFAGDLYGRELMVEIIKFIRPDQAFGDVAALVSQMRLDCVSCADAIAELHLADPIRGFPLGRLQAEGRI